MARTRARTRGEVLFNFDSLCDIITNVMAIMLVMALIAIMLMLGKTYRIKTPYARVAEKNPVFLECRNNRVVRVSETVTPDDPNYYFLFLPYRTVLVPRDEWSGESVSRIQEADSKFNKLIESIDPRTQFAYFFVRPDSFQVYRVAREIIWQADKEAGWTPREYADPIMFSPFGEPPEVDSGS